MCDEFNLNLTQIFEIPGISGAIVHRSKEFQKMITAVQREDISGLVIPVLDRFTRTEKMSVLGDIIRPLEAIMGDQSTKRLWCDEGELDVMNPRDQNTIWVAVQAAARERKNFKRRAGRAKETLRANSTACVDRLPAGVAHDRQDEKVNSGTYRYTPASVKVKTAFERLLAGDTIRAITQAHDSGFSSQTALRKSLKSEWWIGYKTRLYTCVDKEWNAERDRYTTGKRVLIETLKDSPIKPVREKTNLAENPLVTVEMFDAVQAILSRNRNTWIQKRSIVNDYLGTGLVFCKCGRKMYLKDMDPAYYYCASKASGGGTCHEPNINAKRLDAEIQLQTILYLTDKAFIESKLKESMNADAIERTRRAIERAEKEVADLNRQKGNILTAVQKGVGELSDYAAALEKIKIDTAEAAVKIRTLKQELQTASSDGDISKIKAAIIADFASFDLKPMMERKAILTKYIERIDLTFDKVFDTFTVEFTVKAGLPAAYEHTDVATGAGTSGNGIHDDDGTPLRIKGDGVVSLDVPSVQDVVRSINAGTKLETASRTGSLLLLSARFP